jgi:hypothetical protein
MTYIITQFTIAIAMYYILKQMEGLSREIYYTTDISITYTSRIKQEEKTKTVFGFSGD